MPSTDNSRRVSKISLISFVAAGAIAASLIEDTTLPAIPLPGAGYGLNNIFLLIFASFFSPAEILAVQLLKVIVVNMVLRGLNPIGFFISLSGTLAATFVIVLSKKKKPGGVTFAGISVLMAAFHVLSQLLAASLILMSTAPLYYLQLSGIISAFSGFVCGIIANLVKSKINAYLKA